MFISHPVRSTVQDHMKLFANSWINLVNQYVISLDKIFLCLSNPHFNLFLTSSVRADFAPCSHLLHFLFPIFLFGSLFV